MFTIEMLPANDGDALWIEYGTPPETHHILIDCGRKTAYEAVRSRLLPEGAPNLELFVMTHIDVDHIAGGLRLLDDPRVDASRIGDVWFNGHRHLLQASTPPPDALGPRQGHEFTASLDRGGYSWNRAFAGGAICTRPGQPLPSVRLPGGMQLTVLSPTPDRLVALHEVWNTWLRSHGLAVPTTLTGRLDAIAELQGEVTPQPDALGAKPWLPRWTPTAVESYAESAMTEDDSVANGSSVALLAEYDGKAALLTGDAWPSVLGAGLSQLAAQRGIAGPISIDAFKVPHHGSRKNLDRRLVRRVRCPRWLVSTNGRGHFHPNPEAIARIVTSASAPTTLVFNYGSDEAKVWDNPRLRKKWDYETTYGDGSVKVSL